MKMPSQKLLMLPLMLKMKEAIATALTLTPESLVTAFSQFGDRLFGHIFEFESEVYTLLDVVV